MANWQFGASFIKQGEGGLSRATTDTASKNPAPWEWQGKKGWHTNKGITFTTFLNKSLSFGYVPNAANFFTMPDEIWNKIFKATYWDAINADQIKSDVVATYAVSWCWGSGVSGGKSRLRNFLNIPESASISDALNSKIAAIGEKKVFEQMLESRKQQFIAMNQPANLTGWLNRLEKYREKLLPHINKQTTGTVGFFFLTGVVATAVIFRKQIFKMF